MATAHTKTLNSLLRGEISAIETYQQALSKLGNSKGAPDLQRLHQEHIDAANTLRKHIHEHGEKPSARSGSWGAFAKLVEATAKSLGSTAALKALKEGEEHGIKQYEAAIKDKAFPEDCKTLIASHLLPQAREHVPVLDRLMGGLVERISPQEAHRHLTDYGALLVCAYDDAEKCRRLRLEGAISLNDFKALVPTLLKERELIFYCA